MPDRPDRLRQVQGVADRRRGRRRGRAGMRRVRPDADVVDRSRSPTAATAPWPPRSPPGFERVPVAAVGTDRRAGAHGVRARAATSAVVETGRRLRAGPAARRRLAPLTATSRGVRRGDRARPWTPAAASIVLGIGGSASTDGGAGHGAALGARLLDADGAAGAGRRRRRWPTSPARPVRPAPAAGRRRRHRRLRRRQPADRADGRGRGLRPAEGRDPGRRGASSTAR